MKYGMYLATGGTTPSSGVILQNNRILLTGANQSSFLGQISNDSNIKPLLREVWNGFTPASYPVAALSQVADPKNARAWRTTADGNNWIADSAASGPVCQKYTVARSSLTAPATSQDVTLFQLPARIRALKGHKTISPWRKPWGEGPLVKPRQGRNAPTQKSPGATPGLWKTETETARLRSEPRVSKRSNLTG